MSTVDLNSTTMDVNDDVDTEMALTAAAPEVPIDVAETESVHAWSIDDLSDAPTELYTWRRTWFNAAVIAVCGAMSATMLGLGLWAWRQQAHHGSPGPVIVSTLPAPPSASPLPVPSSTASAPTSEAPTKPAPSEPANPQIPVADRNFLAMLHQDGFPEPGSTQRAVAAAGDVCRMVKRGDDLGYVESWMVPPNGSLTQNQAEIFVADALAAYCPRAGIN